jgi:uncharacterized protein (DUF1501 family)
MLSRRIFLKDGAFALVSLGFAPSFLARTVEAAGATLKAKRLIAIFQRGAVDGLSFVVPFGDPAYYGARPSIAIPRPTDTKTARATSTASSACIRGSRRCRRCGLRVNWRSFTRAARPTTHARISTPRTSWKRLRPGVKSTGDGWLNRYLQAKAAASPFRAVALTQQLPRMLNGKAAALAMPRLDQFAVRGPASEQFERAYGEAKDTVMNGTGREAFDAMKMLRDADPLRYAPENGADYPRSAFGQALKQIAQLTKANVGLEVAFADVGGWDTHVNQGAAVGQLATRLDDFGRSIAALVTDLGDRMADTVVLTMSEFGRAVNENGNRGTDHGHGNAMLVIGGGVRGGKVYGRWPGLAVEQRHDRRDLAITTDFRDVFSEIVVRHLAVADAAAIFPGYDVKASKFPGLFG